MTTSNKPRPLCVDLDDTLIATDLLWESILLLIKQRPFLILILPSWLIRGKAHFKRQLAERIQIRLETLPYRSIVIELIKKERSAGRAIILATGSDALLAKLIAQHVGLFDEVLASNGTVNLSGNHKRQLLEERFGHKGYDYVGNGTVDIPIWHSAHTAIVVHPSGKLSTLTTDAISRYTSPPLNGTSIREIVRAARLYQWVKNALLFIPLCLAHKLTDLPLLQNALVGFFGFSFCASAIYVLNDLLDLENDRFHPRKRRRPFASGSLTIPTGIMLFSAFLLLGIGISWIWLPPTFVATLMAYVVFSIFYCLKLKHVVVADVIGLALLYTIRIFAGGEAVGVVVSQWLLTFSIFFFLSLAFMKRFSEIQSLQPTTTDPAGRPYTASDIEMIRSIGPSTGYIAVLVVALYLNSPDVARLYSHPILLWLTGPALLYWVTRMWFLSARGEMTDDPIVAASKDYRSYIVGAFLLLVVYFAI